jgi:hypothetical protein
MGVIDSGRREPDERFRRYIDDPWHVAAGIDDLGCPDGCRWGSHQGATAWTRSRTSRPPVVRAPRASRKAARPKGRATECAANHVIVPLGAEEAMGVTLGRYGDLAIVRLFPDNAEPYTVSVSVTDLRPAKIDGRTPVYYPEDLGLDVVKVESYRGNRAGNPEP